MPLRAIDSWPRQNETEQTDLNLLPRPDSNGSCKSAWRRRAVDDGTRKDCRVAVGSSASISAASSGSGSEQRCV